MIGLKRTILQRVEFSKSENNVTDAVKSSSLREEPLNGRKITDFSIRKILSDDVHISKCPQLYANDTLYDQMKYVSENITENLEYTYDSGIGH